MFPQFLIEPLLMAGAIGPLFRSNGCSCGKLKWCIQQERNQPLGPREGRTPALIPRVKMGVREEVCHASSPPFPLLSLLPHCRVFSLFAGGLLASFLRPLSPFLAPPAGHDHDEEQHHGGDAPSDSQRQQEKIGERGWR